MDTLLFFDLTSFDNSIFSLFTVVFGSALAYANFILVVSGLVLTYTSFLLVLVVSGLVLTYTSFLLAKYASWSNVSFDEKPHLDIIKSYV